MKNSLIIQGQDFSIPLNQQIKNYRKFRESVKNRVGSIIANPYLYESIFIFSTGSNDMFEFLVTFGPQNVSQQGSFVEQLATQFKVQLQVFSFHPSIHWYISVPCYLTMMENYRLCTVSEPRNSSFSVYRRLAAFPG